MKKAKGNPIFLHFLPKHIIHRRVLIITGLVLICVVLLWCALSVSGRVYTGNEEYILYVKNKDLYLADNQSETAKVASNLFRRQIQDNGIYDAIYDVSSQIVVRDQGNRIFFPGNYHNYRYTLSYRDLDNPWQGSVAIGRDIRPYVVLSNGDALMGIDEQSRLKLYDLADSQTVADDVTYFYTDSQLKTVYWTVDPERDLYVKSNDAAAQIVSQKCQWYEISSDMQTVYFLRENTLYKKALGKAAEKLDDNCEKIDSFYPTGELYASSAGPMEYRRLYYYDGQETTELLSNALEYSFAQDLPVGIVKATKAAQSLWYYVSGGQLQLLEYPQIQDILVSPYGNMLAYVTMDSQNKTNLYTVRISNGRLGEPEWMDQDISTTGDLVFMKNGSLRYFKNATGSDADLYIDGIKIDSMVARYICRPSDFWAYPPDSQIALAYCPGNDTFIYYTYFDETKQAGILKLYNGESSVIIDENVTDFQFTASGDIYYLRDYDHQRYRGELWVYSSGENRLIDKGVTALICNQDVDYAPSGN